jgi:hypothetical protein
MKRTAFVSSLVCLIALCFTGLAVAQNVPKEHADVANINPDAKIAGTYTATIHEGLVSHGYDTNQNEKLIKEQWIFKQDGKNITGTEKTEKGELQIKASIDGNSIKGLVMDGEQRYLIALTVDPSDNTMFGSIRMGIHEYLLEMTPAH